MAENRVPITVRLKPAMIEELDDMAKQYHLDRSDVMRALMSVGKRHGDELWTVLRTLQAVK